MVFKSISVQEYLIIACSILLAADLPWSSQEAKEKKKKQQTLPKGKEETEEREKKKKGILQSESEYIQLHYIFSP